MGTLPQIRHRLCRDFPADPFPRNRSDAGVDGQGQGGDGGSQHLPRYLFRNDVFHHRRDDQFQEAMGGRHWQAGRSLHNMSLRLHYMGGSVYCLDVLWRGEAATGCRLITIGAREMEQPKIGEEIRKMEYEPLLPIEKQLIGWSLGIGVVLLGVLVFISRAFLNA